MTPVPQAHGPSRPAGDDRRQWPRAVILMGVSGSGKTTVGQALAQRLGWAFRDADDYHPHANVEKMRAGIPLNDGDRAPWLARLNALLRHAAARNTPLVLACSALRQTYRPARRTRAPLHARVPAAQPVRHAGAAPRCTRGRCDPAGRRDRSARARRRRLDVRRLILLRQATAPRRRGCRPCATRG